MNLNRRTFFATATGAGLAVPAVANAMTERAVVPEPKITWKDDGPGLGTLGAAKVISGYAEGYPTAIIRLHHRLQLYWGRPERRNDWYWFVYERNGHRLRRGGWAFDLNEAKEDAILVWRHLPPEMHQSKE